MLIPICYDAPCLIKLCFPQGKFRYCRGLVHFVSTDQPFNFGDIIYNVLPVSAMSIVAADTSSSSFLLHSLFTSLLKLLQWSAWIIAPKQLDNEEGNLNSSNNLQLLNASSAISMSEGGISMADNEKHFSNAPKSNAWIITSQCSCGGSQYLWE